MATLKGGAELSTRIARLKAGQADRTSPLDRVTEIEKARLQDVFEPGRAYTGWSLVLCLPTKTDVFDRRCLVGRTNQILKNGRGQRRTQGDEPRNKREEILERPFRKRSPFRCEPFLAKPPGNDPKWNTKSVQSREVSGSDSLAKPVTPNGFEYRGC